MVWNLESAQKAFRSGVLQAWVEEYLQVPEWQNLGLLRRVREYSVHWLEPTLVPTSRLVRVAGPGNGYRFPKDPIQWAEEVARIASGNPTHDELPPVIAWREADGTVNLADGNHRVDALSLLGYEQVWVILHDGPLRSPEEILARRQE